MVFKWQDKNRFHHAEARAENLAFRLDYYLSVD